MRVSSDEPAGAIVAGLMRWIEGMGQVVYPKEACKLVKVCDPDNRILECALASKADFLVTGDKKHLLGLKHSFDFQIVSPAQFYKSLFD